MPTEEPKEVAHRTQGVRTRANMNFEGKQSKAEEPLRLIRCARLRPHKAWPVPDSEHKFKCSSVAKEVETP